jgi:type IV secretion system protein VirB10
MLVGAAIALGGAVFLVWMFWGWIAYWAWGQAPDAPPASEPARQFSMGVPLPPPPAVVAPREAPAAPAAKETAPQTSAPPPPPAAAGPKLVRPMMVWQATNTPGMGAAEGVKKAAASDADDDDAGGTGSSKDSAYAKSLEATKVSNERPTPHRFNPRFTIRKGITFDCAPPMPISTRIAGPLWCATKENVYSMDGSHILIPAESQVNGMLERGLGLGDDRAVIVMTDILTAGPDFLPIPLTAATGASPDGQNGVPVDVNEHRWEKLRTTLMFAAVEGLTSVGSAALQHGGNTQYNFGNVSGVGSSLAQIAFQHDMNIPTTGYRGPGRPIKVYINNYIDLSKYYSDTLVRGR